MLAQMMANDLDYCLDEIVTAFTGEKKLGKSATEVKEFQKHINDDACPKYEDLVAKFGKISDYDAREVIPRFSTSYNNAANRIANSSLADNAKYEALYILSTKRAEMGIDKRLREINRGPIPWAD